MTKRGVFVALVLLLGALATPSVAWGHVTLLSATPAVQSSLDVAPTEILLRFSEPVAISPMAIRVLAADGTVLSGEARSAAGDRVVIAPVSGLALGSAYTVRWQVSGQDGHSPAGVFTFGIGVSAPPPTEAVGAAVQEVTGSRPKYSTGGGTSDGRFIAPTGAQVVELGVVNATIHKVNESVRVSELDALHRIYFNVLKNLLA